MSLILTLRKGHDFYVEDERVVVSSINSGVEFVLKLPDGSLVTIDDEHKTNIMPGVVVNAAIPKNQSQTIIRIAIDAPNKKILRGELYRAENKGVCSTCKGARVLKQQIPRVFGSGFVEESFPCPDCPD